MKSSVTKQSWALMGQRLKATKGRIQKHLGPKSPFSPALKKLLRDNHDGILAGTYLGHELRGYTRILKALGQRPNDFEVKELLGKLNTDPLKRREPAILCPIWRHAHYTKLAYIAFTRYMFPAVFEQCFFMTVIMDYAPNLETLEDRLPEYQAKIDDIERRMSAGSKGLMLFGTLEPDLRSHRQIMFGSDLSVARKDLGWDVESHGGWVTSGHIVGRAVQLDEFRSIVDEVFPHTGWKRVRLETFRRTGTKDKENKRVILDNILDTACYLLKRPEWLTKKGVTRKPGNADHEKMLRGLRSAFHGSTLPYRDFVSAFDFNAAIRQWAVFVDRMGPDRICYSVENAYAQKWYSESETQLLFDRGEFHYLHGHTRVEVHRDAEPFDEDSPEFGVILTGRKQKKTIRKRRALRFDEGWLNATDVTEAEDRFAPISLKR